MMKSEKIKLPFGFNKDNEPVHINQVQRGKGCNLVCPACRDPLIAVKGNERQHHFRHETESECARNPESAIHIVAKKLIAERKQIMLPKFEFSLSAKDSKGKEHRTEIVTVLSEKIVSLDAVQVEKELYGMIVDILAEKDNVPLIIEIFYSHKVDDNKRKKIIDSRISAIEIDLSGLTYDDLKDLDSFWRNINDPKRSKWLYNVKVQDKYYQKHKTQLNEMLNKAEEKYKVEEAIRKRKIQQEMIRIQKQEEKIRVRSLKPVQNQMLGFPSYAEELKLFKTEEYVSNLKKNAEAHSAWKLLRNKYHLSLNDLPCFLNADVPHADWIFGCDRRIWQASIYYCFIRGNDGNVFSILAVDSWLQYTAGCKSPLAAKKIAIQEAGHPESELADTSDNVPLTWRTLEAYFKYLDKLRMLAYVNFDPHNLGNFWYVVM